MKQKFLSYLVVLTGWNDPEYRLFPNMKTAEKFVEDEHERRWDSELDDMKKDDEFEEAMVYRILRTGHCKPFSRYSTIADRSGFAEGWIPLKRDSD